MSDPGTLQDLLASREAALEAARRDLLEDQERLQTLSAERESVARRQAAVDHDAKEAHSRLVGTARRGASGAELGEISAWRTELLAHGAALSARLDRLGARIAEAEAVVAASRALLARRLGERDVMTLERDKGRRQAARDEAIEAESETDTLAVHSRRS